MHREIARLGLRGYLVTHRNSFEAPIRLPISVLTDLNVYWLRWSKLTRESPLAKQTLLEERVGSANLYGPWEQSPQRSPGAEFWSGDQGRSPLKLKLNAFIHYESPRSRPICPEMFLENKNKLCRVFSGAMAPLVPLDLPVPADTVE